MICIDQESGGNNEETVVSSKEEPVWVENFLWASYVSHTFGNWNKRESVSYIPSRRFCHNSYPGVYNRYTLYLAEFPSLVIMAFQLWSMIKWPLWLVFRHFGAPRPAVGIAPLYTSKAPEDITPFKSTRSACHAGKKCLTTISFNPLWISLDLP